MVLVGDEKKDDKALNVILGAARIPQAALMLTPGDCVVMKMACPVALLLLITVAIAAPTSPASAAGCASGAAAGAVAGHFVGKGHAVLGAVAGCAVGLHEKHKQERANAQVSAGRNHDPQQSQPRI
jgi:hypothetical protein